MRKRLLFSCLGLVLATVGILTSVAAGGPVGKPVSSADGNSQAIGSMIRPNRLYKRKLTAAALEVITRLSNGTRLGGVPVPTTNVRVDFDRNVRIFSKGYPTCNAAKLQNVSTEIAKRACGRAIIGSGRARALLPVGPQIFLVKQRVTAFNGRPRGRKPVILLHSYGTTPVQTALVLTGVVSNYYKQGYGPRLDVEVPLIAGGTGALTYFNVTVKKSFKYKGKRRSYIYARCPKSKRLKVRSVFRFLDGQSANPVYKDRCQQKPERKRKKRS